jgi:antitoxin (DNA-binding transcriptional repressor) of toxin-antitoxin stability system
MEVNVHEAKTHLSRLLTLVSGGERVTIYRYGRPLAQLVPCPRDAVARRPGADRGTFRIPDDFDAEIPDLNKAFES